MVMCVCVEARCYIRVLLVCMLLYMNVCYCTVYVCVRERKSVEREKIKTQLQYNILTSTAIHSCSGPALSRKKEVALSTSELPPASPVPPA